MTDKSKTDIATVIEKDGQPEYAVLAWDDYQRLRAAATGAALPEGEAERLCDALARGADTGDIAEELAAFARVAADPDEEALPGILIQRLADGEHPVAIWCDHRGLKPVELARRAGLSQPYLSQIIKGKKPGSLNALRAIAGVLDVTIDDLLPAED